MFLTLKEFTILNAFLKLDRKMEMIYLSKPYQVLNTKEAFQGKKEYFNKTKHDHRLLGEEHTLNFISGKQGCCRRPLKKISSFQ